MCFVLGREEKLNEVVAYLTFDILSYLSEYQLQYLTNYLRERSTISTNILVNKTIDNKVK
jgi:hypothetical protein